MANILVYALHYDGAINKNSLGAVSEGAKLAAELGGEAHAILLGENVPQELAAQAEPADASFSVARRFASSRWRRSTRSATAMCACSSSSFPIAARSFRAV